MMWKRCLVTFIIFVIGVNAFSGGLSELQDVRRFKTPKTISFEELIKQRPKEGRYTVTGCILQVAASAFETSQLSNIEATSRVSTAFVPLQKVGKLKASDFEAVVITEEAQTIATINELNKLGVHDATNMPAAWLEKNIDRLVVKRDITGMIENEHLDSSEKDALNKFRNELAMNYLVIKEGEEPSSAIGITCLIIGGLAMSGVGLYWFLTLAALRQASRKGQALG